MRCSHALLLPPPPAPPHLCSTPRPPLQYLPTLFGLRSTLDTYFHLPSSRTKRLRCDSVRLVRDSFHSVPICRDLPPSVLALRSW